MTKAQPWFVNVRAEQLAIVYLTRRSDLVVKQGREDNGSDLYVSLLREGREVGRSLGVAVQGVFAKAVRRRDEAHVEIAPSGTDYAVYQDIPFPVCLFAFTMDDDQGYWKWIRRPVVHLSGARTLTLETGAVFSPLTDQAIDSIIGEAHQWYQSRLRVETSVSA